MSESRYDCCLGHASSPAKAGSVYILYYSDSTLNSIILLRLRIYLNAYRVTRCIAMSINSALHCDNRANMFRLDS